MNHKRRLIVSHREPDLMRAKTGPPTKRERLCGEKAGIIGTQDKTRRDARGILVLSNVHVNEYK